jgi:hypothetical protein
MDRVALLVALGVLPGSLANLASLLVHLGHRHPLLRLS